MLVKKVLFPALRPLLQGLEQDYLAIVGKSGLVSAAAITSRVVRVARCFMLEYTVPSWLLLDELDLTTTFLVHALQPDFGASSSSNADRLMSPSLSSNRGAIGSDPINGSPAGREGGTFISRLNLPVQGMAANLGKAINSLQNTVGASGQTGGPNGSSGSFALSASMQLAVTLASVQDSAPGFIPSHPAGCALEGKLCHKSHQLYCLSLLLYNAWFWLAFLSFFLSPVPLEMLKDQRACEVLRKCITAVVMSVSSLLKDAVAAKSNLNSFDASCKASPLIPLVSRCSSSI